ncbi:PAS domain S-box protein [Candidatus Bathyarchaeota archaeon]|nr:PAS domain S-box protein [Candidatus Bathyarchaeota archaeon]
MALFSENPEAVIFCDKDFRVVDVNSRFIKFFGYSLDEVKGKSLNDIIVPEDRNEEADLIDEKVQNEFVECNTIRIRKDGSEVNVSMSAAPVIVNGNVIGYIKVYKDISDIVTIEEALNRALQKTELLNEKLNTIGSFTRHDVRNKLSAINGYTYLIKKAFGGQS